MQKIWSIALNTYRESVRSKVLYSLLFFAILLVSISALFGSVTIGDQVKVIKDFGLFAISLFSVVYIVVSGSVLLHKELSRKTVYNILSKAVPRWQFLVGKYFGMLLTVVVMLAIMAICFSGFLLFFEPRLQMNLLYAYYHIFLELVIVCAAAIFFSSLVVTPMLIGLFTIGFFLAGRSVSLLLYFTDGEAGVSLSTSFLKLFYCLLPHLERLNVSDRVVYDLPILQEEIIYSTIYGVSYAGVLLVLANMIFRRREF